MSFNDSQCLHVLCIENKIYIVDSACSRGTSLLRVRATHVKWNEAAQKQSPKSGYGSQARRGKARHSAFRYTNEPTILYFFSISLSSHFLLYYETTKPIGLFDEQFSRFQYGPHCLANKQWTHQIFLVVGRGTRRTKKMLNRNSSHRCRNPEVRIFGFVRRQSVFERWKMAEDLPESWDKNDKMHRVASQFYCVQTISQQRQQKTIVSL